MIPATHFTPTSARLEVNGSNLELRHRPLCFAHLRDAVRADFAEAGAESQAGFHPLLSLASVAEPHSHHLLLQVEAFGYAGYFLGGWLIFFHKAALQSLLSSEAVGEKGGKEKREDELHETQHHCVTQFASLVRTVDT